MKIEAKKINNLTWHFEIIREQYVFIKSDIKKLISLNLNNNDEISVSIKLIELSNQLFDVGLANYRKMLKNMCVNFNLLNKVFNLYIKRSKLNVGFAKNKILNYYKDHFFNSMILKFLKSVRKLIVLYTELELVYFKLLNGNNL